MVASWQGEVGGGRWGWEVEGSAVLKDELCAGTNQNADAVVIPAALRLRSRPLPPVDALRGGGGN